MNPHYATVFFRALFVLAAAGGALAAGYASFPLTYPFLIALILSSAIIPVVDWLDKLTGLPRSVNTVIVLV
ncbi:sporulation integral membrane protein YtvI, partial [Bacillus velezensis]